MAIENQVTFAEVGNPKRVTQLTENTDAAGTYFLTEKVGETAAKKTSYATVESAVKSKVQSEYLQTLSVTPASDKTMSEKLVVGELKKRDDKIIQLEQQTVNAIGTNPYVANKFISKLNGSVITDSIFKASELTILDGNIRVIGVQRGNAALIAVYNKDEVFLGALNYADGEHDVVVTRDNIITLFPTATFIRSTANMTQLSAGVYRIDNNINAVEIIARNGVALGSEFRGYFSEEDGYLHAITDKKGHTLSAYDENGQFIPFGGIWDKDVVKDHDVNIPAEMVITDSQGRIINADTNNVIYQRNDIYIERADYLTEIDVDPTADTYYLSFDFRMPNINTCGLNSFPIMATDRGNTVSFTSEKTSLLFRSDYGIDSLLQYPKFNYKFNCFGKELTAESKFGKIIEGDIICTLWLKGQNVDNSTITDKMLSDRASWLSSNRDYSVILENDTFSIIRDGKDVDKAQSAYNGGTTSTIFTTSLKNPDDTYKTLSNFYKEIKSADTNIYVEFYGVSANDTCEVILQFGKIKMVGIYNQQIQDVRGNGTTTVNSYDSFPVAIRRKDESWHTFQLVKQNNKLYVAIDGQMPTYAGLTDVGFEQLVIGGDWRKKGNFSFKNVTLKYQHDCEVSEGWRKNVIISNKTPYILGLMGHWFSDSIEVDMTDTTYMGQSPTRTEDFIRLLKLKGYEVINISELRDIIKFGNYRGHKRYAFLVFDDERIENVYLQHRHQQSYKKHGVKINFANIDSKYRSKPDSNKIINSMAINGTLCHSHSYWHNVPLPKKNSVVLWSEFKEMKNSAIELGQIDDIITYPFEPGWETTHTMLNCYGYSISICNNEPYNYAGNIYNIGRLNMADNQNWNSALMYII